MRVKKGNDLKAAKTFAVVWQESHGIKYEACDKCEAIIRSIQVNALRWAQVQFSHLNPWARIVDKAAEIEKER